MLSLPEKGGFSAGSDRTAETGEPIAAEDYPREFGVSHYRIVKRSSDLCAYLYPTECSESSIDVYSQEGRDGLHKYSESRSHKYNESFACTVHSDTV